MGQALDPSGGNRGPVLRALHCHTAAHAIDRSRGGQDTTPAPIIGAAYHGSLLRLVLAPFRGLLGYFPEDYTDLAGECYARPRE